MDESIVKRLKKNHSKSPCKVTVIFMCVKYIRTRFQLSLKFVLTKKFHVSLTNRFVKFFWHLNKKGKLKLATSNTQL